MKILSLDLSMNLPSFVVLEIETEGSEKKIRIVDGEYVDNKNNSKKSHAVKIKEIKDSLVDLIKRNGLDQAEEVHIVREKGFSRFAQTTQTLFKVVGVSDLIALEVLNCKDMTEITPTSVKKLVSGDGKASKIDVERSVREYLVKDQVNIKFYSDDVSDAVAVGIAYAIKKGLLL